MAPEHIRVISLVHSSALLPLLFIPMLTSRGILPSWVFRVYVASFLGCALGWELWFTYGGWAGDPVHVRRAADLNAAIPTHLNWVLNSLADAGSICLFGVWMTWRAFGRDRTITLQGQIPWLLMGPLFYWALTRHLRRISPFE
jgi:hypothetical protein